ncbi:MAG: 4Fe-4S dicluster domain-containing protein [Hydrogenophilaceae bacterium]|nr:4Fe-4S dicluster domain-containing protein [Hydrogenophilaceae bacterium]
MSSPLYLPPDRLDDLIRQLQERGYRVIGPRVRDAVIDYGELERAADLPWGWQDQQRPGRYRLQSAEAKRAFAWAAPAQGLKPWFFAASEPLWRTQRTAGGFQVEPCLPEAKPLAIFGARACDLAAVARQDRILEHDPHYQARRQDALFIAVHCTHPAESCFCAATDTGPRARRFDLGLTELAAGFAVEAGSSRGRQLLDALDLGVASAEQIEAAQNAVADAARQQTRSLPTGDLAATLLARFEHPRWDQVAQRCLSCGNCTQACPTCFCHAREETGSIDAQSAMQVRHWDSCFGEMHGHLAGFQVRPETKQRYRQWLTHKLGTWWTQFGESGCVGCGRCLTWCPAGIDLTIEAAAILGDTA